MAPEGTAVVVIEVQNGILGAADDDRARETARALDATVARISDLLDRATVVKPCSAGIGRPE
jgi:hypothetical protein